MKHRGLLVLLAICLFSLPALAIHVVVHPMFATTQVGGDVQFHATAHEGMGQPPIPVDDWTWSVDPDSLGTISDSGLFVAVLEGNGEVTASCEIQGETYSGSAHIYVQGTSPPPQIIVTVHPQWATVHIGEERQFHAEAREGWWSPPIPVDEWTWSVDPDSLGTISDSGLFVAVAQGHGTISASCVIEGETYTGDAIIHVMGEPPPPQIIVIVYPQWTTVHVGEERQFHAIAREGWWSPPIPVDDWTWSVDPDSLGTISDSGLFVAAAQGHGTISASCVIEGETYTGEATIHVMGEPPPPQIIVTVHPRWATLYIGGERQFHAEAREGMWHPPIPVDNWTWSVEPESLGTISDSGLFVAAAQGEGHVYASCVIDSVTYTGEATIHILGEPPPPQIFVIVHPWMAMVEVGNQRQFHAMAREGWFHPIPVDEWTWSVEPDSLGTISDSGLFVAAAPGEGNVYASCVIEGVTYTGHARVIVMGENPGGTISGTVVDESGDPIEGACVRAFGGGWWHPHVTQTDDDGNYELSGLAPGTYIVRAWAFGYIGEYWDDQPNWHLADEIQCTGPGFVFDADFELAESSGGPFLIAGIVSDPGLVPLNGAFVFAMGSDEQVYFAAADPDGKFELPVPTGEYHVWAEFPEFETQWYNHVSIIGQAIRVEVGFMSAVNIIEFDLIPVASSAGDPEIATITEYRLDAPYPNPFNPTTTLSYSLASRTQVQLRVYDVLGREVASLVNHTQDAGTYRVAFDGTNLASGNYFVILNAGDATITRQIVLIK